MAISGWAKYGSVVHLVESRKYVARSSAASNRAEREVVLVFGENPNDCRAIAALIEGLCPMLVGRVKVRRPPLMLIKGADELGLRGRTRKTIAAIRAEQAVSNVKCVFLHEDADDYEPAHELLSQRKEAALAGLGVSVHAVTPAWEIEAWWFLWPTEVVGHNPSWQTPDKYLGQDVGRIKDAKEVLRQLLRPPRSTGRFRDYQELDSPGIAMRVRDSGKCDTPEALSQSYDRFRQSVRSCCGAG